MALNVGQLYVNVGANVSGLTSGIKQASQQLQNFGKKMTSIGTKLTATISLPLVAVGKNVIGLAMDAVESEALFEHSMGGMLDTAKEWADGMSSTYGLNATKLKKDIGMMNTMLKSMGLDDETAFRMSKDVVEKSWDMATFYNTSQEDMLRKIKSGLTGQSQPLLGLGINVQDEQVKATALRHGIIGIKEDMTSGQKAIARHITLIEASTTAYGNLDRELENPASQLRIFKEQIIGVGEELGRLFIPLVSKAIVVGRGLIDKWKELSDAKKMMIAKFGLLAVVIPPAITLLGIMVTAIGSLLTPVGLVIGAFSLFIGKIISTESKNLKSTENIADAWENMFSNIGKTVRHYTDTVLKPFLKIWDNFSFAMYSASGLDAKFHEGIQNTFGGNEGGVRQTQETKEFWRDMGVTTNKLLQDIENRNDEYRKNKNSNSRESLFANSFVSNINKETAKYMKPKEEEKKEESVEDFIKSLADQAKGLVDEFANNDGVDKEAQKVASAIDTITSSIISLQESMKAQIGIFDKFKWKATSTWKLLRNAEMRDKAYREREDILSSLGNRGLSQDLVTQLQQTDINELGDLKGLNRMNDEQLMKWAKYTTNADRTAERMANVTVQNVNISIDGKEKNAKELAKEFYRELKLMGVDM